MSDEEKTAKGVIGCATIVFELPAAIIWWVLFGMVLNRLEVGAMEWSLYVGYLILSAIALTGASVFRLLFGAE